MIARLIRCPCCDNDAGYEAHLDLVYLYDPPAAYCYIMCANCSKHEKTLSAKQRRAMERLVEARIVADPVRYGSKRMGSADADDPVKWLVTYPDLLLLFMRLAKL